MRKLCHDKLVHMTALRHTGRLLFAVRAPVCDVPVYFTGIFSNKTFAIAISMSNVGKGIKIMFIMQSPNQVQYAIAF